MTTAQQDADTAPPRDLTDVAELRQRAQDFVRDYIAENKKEPTGELVGRKFGMKERWGRNQVDAVRIANSGTAPARRSGTSGTARRTVGEAVAARESTAAGTDGPVTLTIGADGPARTAASAPARPPAPPARSGTTSGTGPARPARASGTGAAQPGGTAGRLRRLLSGTANRHPASSTHAVSIWVRAVTIVSVSVVAVVAAVVSYVHMHELAEHAGEEWRSLLVPLSVDGLLVAASMVMLVRRQQGEKVGILPWLGVALGLVASLGANVLSVGELSWANLVPIIVSAWPPVALALSVEFLLIVTGGRHRKDGAA